MQCEQGKDAGPSFWQPVIVAYATMKAQPHRNTLTNGPESCASSILQKQMSAGHSYTHCTELEPAALIISPHGAKSQAKLELKPVLNKCLLLAMDRGCCLNKHPRIVL